ncbi:MAG: DUF5412 family protein [Bacilli bacterium]
MVFKTKLGWKAAIFLASICIIIIILNSINFSMIYLPKGEFVASQESPSKEYTLNAYLISYENKDDTAIRVEVLNNKTKKTRNIYWAFPEKTVQMIWVDEMHVDINDTVLHIKNNSYKSKNMNIDK